MKKCYRMFICLMLVACLLLLSGCKGGTNQTGNQTTDQNVTTQNQNANMNSQPEETRNKQENTSETEGQQKEGTVLNGTPLYIDTVGLLGQSESLLPMLLDYETYGLLEGYIATQGKEVYSEAFFQDHSVIALGLDGLNLNSILILSDFQYADGVVTCVFDAPRIKGMSSVGAEGFQYCLIPVDTVLPPDTKIEVEINSLGVDEETYQQMAKQYWNNVI